MHYLWRAVDHEGEVLEVSRAVPGPVAMLAWIDCQYRAGSRIVTPGPNWNGSVGGVLVRNHATASAASPHFANSFSVPIVPLVPIGRDRGLLALKALLAQGLLSATAVSWNMASHRFMGRRPSG
jgi:hypothetical protein